MDYFFAGVFGLIVGFAIYRIFVRAKNAKSLRELAAKLGMHAHPDDIYIGSSSTASALTYGKPTESPSDGIEFIDSFPTFDKGKDRLISSLVYEKRSDGNEKFLFHYTYRIGFGRHMKFYYSSIVVVKTTAHMPALTLIPKGGLSMLKGAVGGAPTLTTGANAFDSKFLVKTSSEKMARAILHPQALEVLQRQDPFQWTMAGPYILIQMSGFQPAETLEKGLRNIEQFVATIPQEYFEEYGLGQPLKIPRL